MPELPPTSIKSATDPDEPGGTGRHEGTPTRIQLPGGFPSIDTGTVIAGRYKLVRELGAGGMGAVWMAEQSEPVRRLVAVKLIRTGMDSREFLARFEAERQALSLMDHPNIARVFDAGTLPDSRPYFVMELVRGTPITKFCDEKRLTARQRLELFIPVCNAIQHAHQKGIIHRDIKPTNVLVAVHDDKPVPKVIDFGVAKATGQPLSEKTMHTLGIVGTPEYMSPEQATENQLDIDTRSDVYSLGVLLYELLTGTTPVKAAGLKQKVLLEILRIVREVDAPRPSTFLSTSDTSPGIAAVRGTEPARLAKELRGELDWIALKALEKDRARRYETANGFAADVQRYLAGEPVLAHPPSTSYRVKKFVRKHRGPVIAASLILLALIGGAVGTVYGVLKAEGEREANGLRSQAESERDHAITAQALAVKAQEGETIARAIAEKALEGEKAAREDEKRAKYEIAFLNYAHAVDLALREQSENNVDRARQLLESCPVELRGWEWRYVHRLCHPELLRMKGHTTAILCAFISEDGRRAVTVFPSNTALIWDLESGQELARLQVDKSAMTSVSLSPDGRRLVTVFAGGTATVWDIESGKALAQLQGQAIQSASFSRDGRRLVTACSNAVAQVCDAETGRELGILRGHNARVRSASFSRDGRRVVTAASNGTARVWDSESQKCLSIMQGHTREVVSASFSEDGRRVVSVSSDRTARVWDPESGNEISRLAGHADAVHSAAFSRDGRRVVTASSDNTARVWDSESGKELVRLQGHTAAITSATFSPDGRRVVTSAQDKTARMWDAATGKELANMGHTARVARASFLMDGRRVITVAADKTAVWDSDAESGKVLACPMNYRDPVALPTMFSEDGRRLVTSGLTDSTRIWEVKTVRELTRLQGSKVPVLSVSVSGDGRSVVTACYDGTVRVWDSESGTELTRLRGSVGAVRAVTLSGDGRRVVTVSNGVVLRVWDAGTGGKIAEWQGHSGVVFSASFSRDGRRLVTGSDDRTARIWDTETGNEIATLRHTTPVLLATFSSDGRRLVTASNDLTARVWDAESGTQVAFLQGHEARVTDASFSRDGHRVVTASDDMTVRVWDAKTGKQMLALTLPPAPKPASKIYLSPPKASFSPDDSVIHAVSRIGLDEQGQNHLFRLSHFDTRPTRETFRKYLEAPPPRAKP